MTIAFDNSYARLPPRFFTRLDPVPVVAPKMIRLNESLARTMGLAGGVLSTSQALEYFAGNALPKGADPIATAYGGHQFGNWAGQLGDGRAILLGEVLGPDGQRWDIQLKGSGKTPYSRGGDGRAVLGAVLREYIVSEAMAALGIPTTRTLAAVTTGETVVRADGSFPGAVLTRVAASHIRVGTFQLLQANGDTEGLRALTDHAIARHYRDLTQAENPPLELLCAVLDRQADLVARWMSVGFIHGVMNTDNTTVSGETIDYGPCAFMDDFHADKTFSSIDVNGRYAWNNQPSIAHWNLMQFAGALMPLIDDDADNALALAQRAVDGFSDLFTNAYYKYFLAKVGVKHEDLAARELLDRLLAILSGHHTDFTVFFRELTLDLEGCENRLSRLFAGSPDYANWREGWQKQLLATSDNHATPLSLMKAANPVYIPRNHRIEAAITAANDGDFRLFHTLLDVVTDPFVQKPDFAPYERPPQAGEVVHKTFCGT